MWALTTVGIAGDEVVQELLVDFTVFLAKTESVVTFQMS